MPIFVNEVVTEKITSTGSLTLQSESNDIKIGSFTWPTAATVTDGSVLKTDATGALVFEPSTIRSVVTGTTYSISANDDIVAITIAQATTLTLPDPTTKNVGDLIYIQKEIAGTDIITIVPFGTELISGQSSVELSFSYGSVKIYTNGINWFALF